MAEGDEFTTNLWNVHRRVKEEGYVQVRAAAAPYSIHPEACSLQQPLSLGLFRSDYLVHQDAADTHAALQIKQVEFNTIASSFSGLSTKTCLLHKSVRAP